jgi:hypothetical protein
VRHRESKGVVGRRLDGSVEGGRRVRGTGEERHRLTFGVVAAPGEFANDARGRLQRHTEGWMGSGKSVPEVQNLQLGRR